MLTPSSLPVVRRRRGTWHNGNPDKADVSGHYVEPGRMWFGSPAWPERGQLHQTDYAQVSCTYHTGENCAEVPDGGLGKELTQAGIGLTRGDGQAAPRHLRTTYRRLSVTLTPICLRSLLRETAAPRSLKSPVNELNDAAGHMVEGCHHPGAVRHQRVQAVPELAHLLPKRLVLPLEGLFPRLQVAGLFEVLEAHAEEPLTFEQHA